MTLYDTNDFLDHVSENCTLKGISRSNFLDDASEFAWSRLLSSDMHIRNAGNNIIIRLDSDSYGEKKNVSGRAGGIIWHTKLINRTTKLLYLKT